MGDQQVNGTSAPGQPNGQQNGQRGTPPMTLLLRRPAQVVRQRVLTGLREAGFDDILPAHLGRPPRRRQVQSNAVIVRCMVNDNERDPLRGIVHRCHLTTEPDGPYCDGPVGLFNNQAD